MTCELPPYIIAFHSTKEFNRTNPHFILGRRTGLLGLAPPPTLNDIIGADGSDDLDAAHYWTGYTQGIEGFCNGFAGLRGINATIQLPKLLARASGLEGFIYGWSMGVLDPNIVYEWRVPREPDTTDFPAVNRYNSAARFGLHVGVAHHHGVMLRAEGLPIESRGYHILFSAFQCAMQDKPFVFPEGTEGLARYADEGARVAREVKKIRPQSK